MPLQIEPFYEQLGRRIRLHREQRGWSQDALGQQLSPPMGRASIANIENAKQRVLAHTLVDFARVFQIEVTDLVPAPKIVPSDALDRELAAKLPGAVVEKVLSQIRSVR